MSQIVRTVHNGDHPYTVITKSALEDERLSWAARGVLAYLLCKPDNWKTVKDLIGKDRSERDAIQSALKELEECGYLSRIQVRGEHGRWERGYRICESVNLNHDFPRYLESLSIDAGLSDCKAEHSINNQGIKYSLTHNDKAGCAVEKEKKLSKFSVPQRREYAAAKKLGDGWMVSSADGRYDELIAGWLEEDSAPIPCQECGDKKACADETTCGWFDSQRAAKRARRP